MSDSLNESSLRHLARLACIELSAGELDHLPAQFHSILGLIDRLQQVDTQGVKPLAQSFDLPLRLREDEITTRDRRARFQSLAPEVADGLYLVPRVIE
ncbi:Asp-tRNA(Asn)/Glu-tRNA(Gln) amidotransferase subunit GatC [Ferrovum sp.]|uniref:Asp-tRNA(Asn)/Glu-tRNA(Gln) amidotransferase subunit GatC n=1 Tax=Ferrovum sp. TaxID=2609467 RepID=UPI0026081890|nr:Asp-tRNA(Asn)/Glu-tRNA(Gln) amidotransferase subunit GatC [Ferrovum sp.]